MAEYLPPSFGPVPAVSGEVPTGQYAGNVGDSEAVRVSVDFAKKCAHKKEH